MRIIQVIPNLVPGDAISNFSLQLKSLLASHGYKTEIYADQIGNKLPRNAARNHIRNAIFRNDDIILYHMSTGTPLNQEIANLDRRKIMIFHNITPPDLYWKYDYNHASKLAEAYDGLKNMVGKFDAAIVMSEFNKKVLVENGYSKSCIFCLPSYIFDSQPKTYSYNLSYRKLVKYADQKINVLFVGRVVPHKCHEDIIAAVAWFQKHISPNIRLFLVGSLNEKEYVKHLKGYISGLGVDEIYLPGKVSDEELKDYYRLADIFLCLSEYEGFCIPIVEAMQYGIPVIAYNAAAIPQTLGTGGILLSEKNPVLTAKVIEWCMNDRNLYASIVQEQIKQLEKFSYQNFEKAFFTFLESFLNKAGDSYNGK